uniref:Glycine cleavage system H protein n=1 Tax=Panagrellus redivivus TaxID=6233 RepID=A0A7E4VYJ9_PANRE
MAAASFMLTRALGLSLRAPVIATRCFSASAARFTDRYYTKKHEWISVSGKTGTVGISDFAQEALGDVVYVELPEVGATVAQGDAVGAIESVKAASDVYSPASGNVTEVNSEIEDTPGLINKSAYEKGWLYKLELSDADELKSLLNEDAYEKFKLEEAHDE